MLHLAAQVEESVAHIRRRYKSSPAVGIVLGTGLCSLADGVQVEAVIPYGEIPHFPRSTAVSHDGQLVCGTLAGVPVVAMAGRTHAYEGYSLKQATLPIRVIKALGARLVVLSNAAGGLNPSYLAGDVMVIEDHIDLLRDNPLIGINHVGWDQLAQRAPAHQSCHDGGPAAASAALSHPTRTPHSALDMRRPYDPKLVDDVLGIARREAIVCHRGVYIAVTGPNLETRAEYRILRRIGGDVVGMSTVPEALAAVHCGLRVLAFSIISNVCLPDALAHMSIEEIVATCNAAEPKLRRIVLGLLESRRW